MELPRIVRKEMKALTSEEALLFLKTAKSGRYYALWNLLLTTGLRPGEALGLKWGDLQDDKLRIQRVLSRVDGQGWTLEEPKTNKSRRAVTIPATTMKVLQHHRISQAGKKLRAGPGYADLGFVFATQTGRPLDHRVVVRRRFHPVVERAQIPHIRPYDLRHTCATLLLAAGEHPKVVSERLGHSSVTITLDTYSHVLPDMQQRAAERIEHMLFGNGF